MNEPITSVTVGVDLGKTTCRAVARCGDVVTSPASGPGAVGLAEPEGVAEALTAVLTTVGKALDLLAAQGFAGSLADGSVAVGAAGAEAAPGAARRIAEALLDKLGASRVAVASDSLTAHLGALSGRPGAVISIGTGAVALAVDAAGVVRRTDGWGPWLGDDGSGAWIGREGLRAVLLAAEGRAPDTALTALAQARFGPLSQLPRAVSEGGQTARTLAGFAPDVLSSAAAGDEVALDVVRRAGTALAGNAACAARAVGVTTVTAVGGLAGAPVLMDAFLAELPAGLSLAPSDGSAVDGALLLAAHDDLPHETHVLRVAPPDPRVVPPDGLSVDAASSVVGDRVAAVDVDLLATERVRPDLFDLDERSPEQLVDLLLEAEAAVPEAMARARQTLAAAVSLVDAAFEAGGRLIYVGAGTPGRLAAVDAAECPPTFGTSPDQVVAILAGGDRAAVSAVEGAEDDADAGTQDVAALAPGPHDVVVGITASGRTPYVLGALEVARSRGAATIAVVNNPDSPVRSCADVTVELLTGGEVLAGSTRLKAGTSQKIALNVLSTSAMIRAGKTYGAWMVDVMASNEKLRRRARRILREATGVDDDTAVAALDACGWHTKTAMVSVLTGLDADAARRRLDEAGGRVRQAVDQHRPPATGPAAPS